MKYTVHLEIDFQDYDYIIYVSDDLATDWKIIHRRGNRKIKFK